MAKIPFLSAFYFLLFYVPAQNMYSQGYARHMAGVSFGLDAISLITSLKEDDLDYYEDDHEYEEGGTVQLGLYYKFKPLLKWDFDIGYKIAAYTLGSYEHTENDLQHSYSSKADHLAFTRVNFYPWNAYENKLVIFYTSFETGRHWSDGRLFLSDTDGRRLETENLLTRNIYFEYKIGLKAALQNNQFFGALAIDMGINNIYYGRCVYDDLKSKDKPVRISGGPALIMSLRFEFNRFNKGTERKTEKINYPDWFRPVDE
ncbi:MAG: hypothetical protein PWQ06_325 [Anaerophaga sp.]|nr:hypothetical protein [Anaerophaga sp.]